MLLLWQSKSFILVWLLLLLLLLSQQRRHLLQEMLVVFGRHQQRGNVIQKTSLGSVVGPEQFVRHDGCHFGTESGQIPQCPASTARGPVKLLVLSHKVGKGSLVRLPIVVGGLHLSFQKPGSVPDTP